MWDYILTFLVGAAVPILTNQLQRKDDRKKFGLERKDKYKLVAVEKRLEAHQQAFYHWRKLLLVIHGTDSKLTQKTIENAREFWNLNSLYLEYKTRQRFDEILNRVSNHPALIINWKNSVQPEQKALASIDVKENWKIIHEFGDIIQRDVQLQSINLEIPVEPETGKHD